MGECNTYQASLYLIHTNRLSQNSDSVTIASAPSLHFYMHNFNCRLPITYNEYWNQGYPVAEARQIRAGSCPQCRRSWLVNWTMVRTLLQLFLSIIIQQRASGVRSLNCHLQYLPHTCLATHTYPLCKVTH